MVRCLPEILNREEAFADRQRSSHFQLARYQTGLRPTVASRPPPQSFCRTEAVCNTRDPVRHYMAPHEPDGQVTTLRNPQRLSLCPSTGAMWRSSVGLKPTVRRGKQCPVCQPKAGLLNITLWEVKMCPVKIVHLKESFGDFHELPDSISSFGCSCTRF